MAIVPTTLRLRWEGPLSSQAQDQPGQPGVVVHTESLGTREPEAAWATCGKVSQYCIVRSSLKKPKQINIAYNTNTLLFRVRAPAASGTSSVSHFLLVFFFLSFFLKEIMKQIKHYIVTQLIIGGKLEESTSSDLYRHPTSHSVLLT